MCGIVGYVGQKNATPILIDALKKLEYRGYDSAGIAVLGQSDIIIKKAKGALKHLQDLIAKDLVQGTLTGNIGIGHTRWATHGEPSEVNAHPHTNQAGNIAVVHNGIIENYITIKAFLQEQGVVFKSQTDSEVVAHLINYYWQQQKDIYKAVRLSTCRLVGSYALAVICKDFPDRIVVARKDCPLVVGQGKNENFVASDVPALLEHTREVFFLEQDEMAVLYADHIDLFSPEGNKIIKKPYHIEYDMAAAQKEGYAHFMLKEIHEQPRVLKDFFLQHLTLDKTGNPCDIKFLECPMQDAFKTAKRIVIVACGTAYHAGCVAKYAFEKFARLQTEVDTASEFRYKDPLLNTSDVFIVISQSGETADTLAALRLAKKNGNKILAITNCVGSTVSREADVVVYTTAGPEIAVASTKAYIAQIAALYLLALKTANLKGLLQGVPYTAILKELNTIPQKIQQILDDKALIQKIASLQFNKQKIFFIGRLFDASVSLESALKLKEVSYMHSEAFAAGELKHGPIALLDATTLVVALATQKPLYEKIRSNILEVSSRGAATLVITQDKTGVFSSVCDKVFTLPDIQDPLSPLISVVVPQLFAYYCAVYRGCDPDKPRNLAKSVTVE